MSKTEKTTPAITLDALETAAFAEMTAVERLNYTIGKQSREIQRETLELQRSQARISQNNDAPVAEKMRVADERHAALAAARRSFTAVVDVPLELDQVQSSPTVNVRVRLDGFRRGADETDGGQHQIVSAAVIDGAEAERLLKEDVYRPHLDAFAERERAGDTIAIMTMRKSLDGRGSFAGAPGLLHRYWGEVTKPILLRLVGRGPLEKLLASSACKLIGEIEVSPEAPRTVLDTP